MTDPLSQEIEERKRINGLLDNFCALEGWTPAMGAMLIAGLHPTPGCTEIFDGCASLRNSSVRGDPRAIRRAREALKKWTESHEEDMELGLIDHVPAEVTPTEFLMWSMEEYSGSPDTFNPSWLRYWLSYAGWDAYGDSPTPAPPALVVRAAQMEGFAAIRGEVQPSLLAGQAEVTPPQGHPDDKKEYVARMRRSLREARISYSSQVIRALELADNPQNSSEVWNVFRVLAESDADETSLRVRNGKVEVPYAENDWRPCSKTGFLGLLNRHRKTLQLVP